MASDACVKCGQPGLLFCEHADVDGQVSTTAYCSKTCQAANWPAHKTGCSAGRQRLQLYRGGELLQDIFYILRGQAFDSCVTKVEKDEDGLLHVHEACPLDDEVLSEFPQVLPQTFDEDDKRAMLSFLACSFAQILHTRLVEKAFAGIYKDIDECTAHLRKSMRRIIRHGPSHIDNTDFRHTVARLTMKKGERHVLDISGAQFGQHRAVVPRSEYDRLFLRPGSDPWPEEFGHSHGWMRVELLTKSYATTNDDQRLTWVTLRMKAQLDRVIAEWEDRNGLPLAKLLQLSRARFETERAHLLKAVSEEMSSYVRQSKEDGTFAFERVRGEGADAVWLLKPL